MIYFTANAGEWGGGRVSWTVTEVSEAMVNIHIESLKDVAWTLARISGSATEDSRGSEASRGPGCGIFYSSSTSYFIQRNGIYYYSTVVNDVHS